MIFLDIGDAAWSKGAIRPFGLAGRGRPCLWKPLTLWEAARAGRPRLRRPPAGHRAGGGRLSVLPGEGPGRRVVMSRRPRSCRRPLPPRRPGCSRPQLLTLEDRLPLGDALLGALVGAALAGPGPAALHAGPGLPADPA